jgi:lysophospholipase L1-like esterase
MLNRIAMAAFAMLLALSLRGPTASADDQHLHWVGTWGASPDSTGLSFNNQTIRQTAGISIGGDRVRVRLSNEMSSTSLVIGAAHIAIAVAGASILPSTDRVLTFSGQPSITIPGGAPVVSDPVDLDIPALSSVAISIFLPDNTGPATAHALGEQTAYISPTGDFTATTTLPIATTSQSRFFISAIYVSGSADARAVATLGDSITDGFASTPDTDRRWPDRLAERLAASRENKHTGVVNEGISGNRILHNFIGPNALSRLDRDVLAQPVVRFLTLLEGINDIGFPGAFSCCHDQSVSADDIIDGYKQLIARAHDHNLKIYGATLTPFEGASDARPGYFTPEGEAKRAAINTFIRTSDAFDAVIDFDAVVRDPGHPTRILAAFDSGDHLHPNDAGYTAMADSIYLRLFTDDASER